MKKVLFVFLIGYVSFGYGQLREEITGSFDNGNKKIVCFYDGKEIVKKIRYYPNGSEFNVKTYKNSIRSNIKIYYKTDASFRRNYGKSAGKLASETFYDDNGDMYLEVHHWYESNNDLMKRKEVNYKEGKEIDKKCYNFDNELMECLW